jgi:hypothetical protein
LAGIAILGWGSLLWDKKPEFDDQIGNWQSDGPTLMLEFSRVSSSRDGALTLVIDEKHGSLCRVSFAVSKRRSLDDAVCDLRCREGTILRRIGILSRDGRTGEPQVPQSIADWLNQTDHDAVVWTGLSNNFREKAPSHNCFSVDEAIYYLRSLPPKGKAEAAEYIWRAPEFIRTALRDAV